MIIRTSFTRCARWSTSFMEVFSTAGMGVWDSRTKFQTLWILARRQIWDSRTLDSNTFGLKQALENNLFSPHAIDSQTAPTLLKQLCNVQRCFWKIMCRLWKLTGRIPCHLNFSNSICVGNHKYCNNMMADLLRLARNMFQSAASQPRMKVMLYQNIALSPSNLCTRVNSMIDIANDMAATTF